MKKALLLLLTIALLFTDCAWTARAEKHEAITFSAPFYNASNFVALVNEKYPEINLEFIPYNGQNTTAYTQASLNTGYAADIYCATTYSPDVDDLSDKLLDLSGYTFTDNYVKSRLHEISDRGTVYLLPALYSCLGIVYNRAILEKEGWSLPQSLNDMAELKKKAEAKGYQFSLTQMQYPGNGFQYMCNIADTDYLSTMDGRAWQRAFLRGEATLADSPEMLQCFQTIEKWRDLGLLNASGDARLVSDVRDEMAEGNTLFMLGASNDFTRYGEDVANMFGLMPYLSEDGTQNVYILSTQRYYGLSKRLAEPGSEQKLEDALHVMELLSTPEGLTSLYASEQNVSMFPLKDTSVQSSNHSDDEALLALVNAGYTAPFIYSGWENIVVGCGQKMFDFMRGDCSIEDVVQYIDDNQYRITQQQPETFTTVAEVINTEDCARFVGAAFGEAVNADAALISLNAYYGILNDSRLNPSGVSGALFPMPITDQEITTILPTGWTENISTVTLTGARIKELAQTGYEIPAFGAVYPYVLETKGDQPLEDDQTYTVVVCGVTDAVAEEGQLQDTGVLGLDAAKTYLKQFGTLSAQDIHWD